VNLGLIEDLKITDINDLFIHTQPGASAEAHGQRTLQRRTRNIERARYLRRYLNGENGARRARQN